VFSVFSVQCQLAFMGHDMRRRGLENLVVIGRAEGKSKDSLSTSRNDEHNTDKELASYGANVVIDRTTP